ncbi:MAG: hypothetical protein AB7K68_16230 [Bacteriovoracia bacterium]
MNAVNGIFVALALVFGGGYALDKIYVSVKAAAIERIHRGQPSLGQFTNRLTCSKFTPSGEYVATKCGRTKIKREIH